MSLLSDFITGKSKKSKQKSEQTTTFAPLPLGKPAFFGRQEELFTDVGDIISKRLKDPLTSPGFATGRDFLSRRSESLKRGVRGAPNIFAGLRRGAMRDIESTETRALSDLISQIIEGVERNALAFATRPIQRGGVAATSATGQTKLFSPNERVQQILFPTVAEMGGGSGIASLASIRGGSAAKAASSAFSDRKLKKNIKDLKYGLKEVKEIKPREFDFKEDGEHSIGVIAQEIKEIIPEIVSGDEGMMKVDYSLINPVLINAVKELADRVKDLENGK